MKVDLLVKGGKIVTADGILNADLGITHGKVAGLFAPDSEISASEIFDASGKYILPGLVDAHVHAGHGDPDRETFENASKAAAAGGITTMLEQSLSTPATVTVKAYKDKIEAANQKCVIDFGLWGGVVPGNYDEIEGLFSLGGHAYKSFMCRCSNYPMAPDGILLKGMQKVGELGGLVAVHAENDTLIYDLIDEFTKEGRRDVKAYIDSHLPYTELEAIERFIFLARQAPKCKAHIVHVSVPDGIDMVRRAQAEGVNITAETCPQYLGLTEDHMYEKGGVAKCDPPVRSRELVDKMWDHVLKGHVDLVASDHSPHPFEKKVVPMDEFDRASEGVTSLQTMLSVLLTEGVHKRGMCLSQLVRLTSLNPAKRFGLYPQKGALEVGFDADFVVLDLDAEFVCHKEDMLYLNRHTPYDGRTFKGKVTNTFLRGTCIYADGEIKVQEGFGKFVPMHMTK